MADPECRHGVPLSGPPCADCLTGGPFVPRPDDLAAIRAEGRRLLAEATDGPWHQAAAAAWSGTNEDPDLVADCPLYADAIAIVWLRNHADALLADPAPEGLSPEDGAHVLRLRELRDTLAGVDSTEARQMTSALNLALAIIARLSASTDPAIEGLTEEELATIRIMTSLSPETGEGGDDG